MECKKCQKNCVRNILKLIRRSNDRESLNTVDPMGVPQIIVFKIQYANVDLMIHKQCPEYVCEKIKLVEIG